MKKILIMCLCVPLFGLSLAAFASVSPGVLAGVSAGVLAGIEPKPVTLKGWSLQKLDQVVVVEEGSLVLPLLEEGQGELPLEPIKLLQLLDKDDIPLELFDPAEDDRRSGPSDSGGSWFNDDGPSSYDDGGMPGLVSRGSDRGQNMVAHRGHWHPQPVLTGQVCRSGYSYCFYATPQPVGNFCNCYTWFGVYRFSGVITTW